MKGRKLEQTLWCWKPVGKNTWFPIYIVIKIKAHLILLCLALLCFTDTPFFFSFFKYIEGLWQPCMEQAYQHHFSNSICSLCVSVSHFGNSHNISNFPIIFTFVMMMCDQ